MSLAVSESFQSFVTKQLGAFGYCLQLGSVFVFVHFLLDLQFVVSSQAPYSLLALWGVSIRELHLLLWRPWSHIQAQLQAGHLMQGFHQQAGISLKKTSHGDCTSTLVLPEPPLDLGTPPRLCYPLVVFLVRNDIRSLHPDETVALVNVIHIKDDVCTLSTSILAQYLKQANGQLSCLKQLYLATGNPLSYEEDEATLLCPEGSEEDESSSSVWNSAGEQLCVVCQYFPLSRALLPCRHTCICASCFGKLERCPMCRSPIKSYFCIRGEEYMPVECDVSKPSKIGHFFQGWNNRFIDFLGLR